MGGSFLRDYSAALTRFADLTPSLRLPPGYDLEVADNQIVLHAPQETSWWLTWEDDGTRVPVAEGPQPAAREMCWDLPDWAVPVLAHGSRAAAGRACAAVVVHLVAATAAHDALEWVAFDERPVFRAHVEFDSEHAEWIVTWPVPVECPELPAELLEDGPGNTIATRN
jgi:hypothetical protein